MTSAIHGIKLLRFLDGMFEHNELIDEIPSYSARDSQTQTPETATPAEAPSSLKNTRRVCRGHLRRGSRRQLEACLC